MVTQDVISILQWWFMFFGVGLLFLPITFLIFNKFYDKGYIFSKTLGIVFISYLVFVLGISKLLPFTSLTLFIILGIFLIVNYVALRMHGNFFQELKTHFTAIFLEEGFFFAGLVFWSFIRAHEPSINGLEKYMDFGFVNSILRSSYFPPIDMWFPPFPINYYYFGHLITAVLIKLSRIAPEIGYNLMLSTLFSLCFSSAFSIGFNLIRDNLGELNRKKVALGILAGLLVSFSGNLHVIYASFSSYNVDKPQPFWELTLSPFKQNSYWYANATRFIPYTIHEFPLYSFVVSDLHGHVLDIPFVLFTIALLLQIFLGLNQTNRSQAQNSKLKTQNHNVKLKALNFEFSFYTLRFALYSLLLAFLLAVMYMTNVWDGLIYFLLSILVLAVMFFIQFNRNSKEKVEISRSGPEALQGRMANLKSQNCNSKLKTNMGVGWQKSFYHLLFMIIILGVGFFVFSLPFSIHFKPFVSGMGVLCAPDFLTKMGKLGPFLFEADHCQRSPWWQLLILYGFFYFFVASFISSLFRKKNPKHEVRNPKQYQNEQNSKRFENWHLFRNSKFEIRNLASSDIYILLLILLSTLLIIIPEFIYVKDIYPAHYRANTMFKLVYQAFMMLSIVAAYTFVTTQRFKDKTLSFFKRLFYLFYLEAGAILILIVLLYSSFAINAYYRDLKQYEGLDGLKYLRVSHSYDYEAIVWMNTNISGQPVILEAQGDSYTEYERVSANTGLPTVLGWTVHEWLWRGTYDIPAPRIEEVRLIYESDEAKVALPLLKKHKVSYVYVGRLEREKYKKIQTAKFDQIGEVVYQNAEVKIYRIKG